MWYEKTKVYHDGSHYVGIPHTENKRKLRPKPQEAVYVVSKSNGEQTTQKKAVKMPTLELLDDDEEELLGCPFEEEIDAYFSQNEALGNKINADMVPAFEKRERKIKTKRVTRGSEFERLYKESQHMTVKEQKKYIMDGLRQLFKNAKNAEWYVDRRMFGKYRALVERRKRFARKAYMNNFNYFVTFTYDDKKQTEETFRKKLPKALQNLSTRNGWRYMGVWERGGQTNRLHFHALLKVPEGAMVGELIEKRDFNFDMHRMRKTMQNTFFNERFGRCDFEKIIDNPIAYIAAVEYILKYISKSGERIVYSRGLPMYVIADIHEEDVLCRTGKEDRKLVLHDQFGCWDEGEYLGAMSEETKRRLRSTSS